MHAGETLIGDEFRTGSSDSESVLELSVSVNHGQEAISFVWGTATTTGSIICDVLLHSSVQT